MKKTILFISFLCMISCISHNEYLRISQIGVYYFNEHGKGYTTAGAYSQLEHLKKEGRYILMDNADCEVIQKIINKSKISHLVHGKIGLNILFFYMYFDNDKSFHNIVLCQNNSFIDYTKKRVYYIKYKEDAKLLDSIRKKYNLPMIN